MTIVEDIVGVHRSALLLARLAQITTRGFVDTGFYASVPTRAVDLVVLPGENRSEKQRRSC
jgi:hypothetical protein